MATGGIRFEDGAGYERMMGTWSRLAGERFLDWVQPASALHWVDVGCGNGAFTQLVADRCDPAGIEGIDPSEPQLAYARQRGAGEVARFTLGDAQALPYADGRFDIAAMALVIFFVPDPARGLAEMVRVTKPGGTVCAYAWDILNGGFPLDAVQRAMREMGIAPQLPPSVEVSRLDNMRGLWAEGGLADVEGTTIHVERAFGSFEDYWEVAMLGSSVGGRVRSMDAQARAELKSRVKDAAFEGSDAARTIKAFANAVKGRVPS